jgi:pimeloyl-ACP methyl ester carboxylesterase
VGLVAALGCVLAWSGTGDAQAAVLSRCAPARPLLCGRVSVPLARDGALPGRRISLAVRLVPARGRRLGTILFLAGGPGQAAIPTISGLVDPRLSPLAPLLRHRDLLVFDQRGTGQSGLLRCPALEVSKSFDANPEQAQCAQRLGPRRDYYQSRDSADDIEAVRAALRIPRLSVVAVSYGTMVALDYARRYPQRVQRLVLDSVVGLRPDPFSRETLNAVARVLRDICQGGCRAIEPDPVADLQALVASLRSGPLLGYVVGPDGRRRGARLERLPLLNLVVTGDLGPPTIFAELPGALRAWRQGDPAPLLRLSHIALAVSVSENPRELSAALNSATLCTEAPEPWSLASPPDARLAQAYSAATALGDAGFAPFDARTAFEAVISGCLTWPTPARPPEEESGPLPPVPSLLLNGVDDLRTPLEGAQEVAAALPRAQLVSVADTGHSTMTTDLTGCAGRAMVRFFLGRPTGRCARGRRLLGATPLPPASLAAVRPAPGVAGRAGRTLCAVASTMADARVHAIDPFYEGRFPAKRLAREPGLRSGAMTLRLRGRRIAVALRRFSYVPGVSITGSLRGGELLVQGLAAARGTLRVSATGAVSGRLGGRVVRTSLRSCLPRQLSIILFGPEAARRAIASAARLPIGRSIGARQPSRSRMSTSRPPGGLWLTSKPSRR